MFRKSKKGYYFWSDFLKKYGIFNAFSTKKFGNLKIKNLDSSCFEDFCNSLGIKKDMVTGMREVHGRDVVEVTKNSQLSIVDSVDGLISSKKKVFLFGTFADCVPIVFFDKNKRAFGIAHAGWRGVYKEIAKEMINKMRNLNVNIDDVIVGIGPSIRSCCYSVDSERKKLFEDKFPKWGSKVFKTKREKIFLDLQNAIKHQLMDSGVLKQNIKDCKICVSDNTFDFFSYRKEKDKSNLRVFGGIIGRS